MKSVQRILRPAGLLSLAGLALAGAMLSAPATAPAQSGSDQFATLPSSLTLYGVVRDFKGRNESGGHPDFQYQPTAGFGMYANMVADQLDQDGKPVFRSQGNRVSSQARDAQGRNIIPTRKEYMATRSGDVASSVATSNGGALSTSANFAQWYRDVPGTNLSRIVPIVLTRQPNTNIYSFSDRTDPGFSSLGGFFPINGQLFGNTPGQSRNFGFTFEVETEFVYKRGTGQSFTFTGDDDVWVFIDNRLVVDLGGVKGALSQSVDLDRLSWLQDNQTYKLKLFFAERHTTQSNVRIDTTINLKAVDPPPVTGLFD